MLVVYFVVYTYIFLAGDLKFISVISDYSHASEIKIDSNVWYIFKLIFKQVIMLIILKQAQTTWSRKEDVYDLHHGLTVANENLLYLSTRADLVNILSFSFTRKGDDNTRVVTVSGFRWFTPFHLSSNARFNFRRVDLSLP